MAGESIVAAVVGRNRHDGACAVACEHVVADINGYFFARQRVDGVAAAEDAGHFLIYHALAFGAVLDGFEICVYGLFLFGGGKFFHILALGGEYHESHAEDGVGACGEYFEVYVVATIDSEVHFSTFRAADPVALCLFDGFRPVDAVETFEETFGIGRHSQTPLPHFFLLDGVAAAHRHTFADFVVGQHGAEFRTPVDHCVGLISEAVVHQGIALFLVRHGLPFGGGEVQFLIACGVYTVGALCLEACHEIFDRHGAVGGLVVV